jgi:hypothetical protein
MIILLLVLILLCMFKSVRIFIGILFLLVLWNWPAHSNDIKLGERVDAHYQELANDPKTLPALAHAKVAASTCKFELPEALNLLAHRFQQRQPEAYQTHINAAKQDFENVGDMKLLACTMAQAVLNEAARQAK